MGWPLLIVKLTLYWAICEKFYVFTIMLVTIFLSLYFFKANLVKKLTLVRNNSQITKHYLFSSSLNHTLIFRRFKCSLVGISETTRSTTNFNNLKFNQWLAGLIDGAGCLKINKQNVISCEIILSLDNEKALRLIKNHFGGSIKLRAGNRIVRYRLRDKSNIIKLINAINGNIYNNNRLIELHHTCLILNIPIISSIYSHNNSYIPNNSSWFAGYFDTKGFISYSFINNKPQLVISLEDKSINNVNYFVNRFNGSIIFNNSRNGLYIWHITTPKDILSFVDYIKIHPSRTILMNKILLCKLFFELSNLKAYAATPSSNLFKSWLSFEKRWQRKF
uniref:Orf333 n=1 Tax=Schizosaccharomyces japonicus (strain yFS275 / FY16936) TaxID=402676 RepID=Q8HMZ5_SCHJY